MVGTGALNCAAVTALYSIVFVVLNQTPRRGLGRKVATVKANSKRPVGGTEHELSASSCGGENKERKKERRKE